jgi:hypothetical protein
MKSKQIAWVLGCCCLLAQACTRAHDLSTETSGGAGAGPGLQPASPSAGSATGTASTFGGGSAATSGTPVFVGAGADLTFVMTGQVAAGQELQNCISVQLPADRGPIAINSAESHYTPGSHHFLVYRTGQTMLGAAEAVVHPCTSAEQSIHLNGTYYEAQAPDSSRALPPGIAHLFQPGEVLLFTSHYVNTTQADLDAKVTFVLHTMDPAQVQQEAGSIFFYNPLISIPAASKMTVTRSCPVTADIHLALLWSHMHSRGVAFSASSDDAATADDDLYETTQWNEPAARQFPYDPPITLHAGSTITYSCTYENPSDKAIVAGQSAATNEMCILHGMYWPRIDPQMEQCFQGQSSSGEATPLP